MLKKILPMIFVNQIRAQIKRFLNIPLVDTKLDNKPLSDCDKEQIRWAIGLLLEARHNADFVVACVHSGGQFTLAPGIRSIQLYEMLEPYCDAMIGNHPHVIQRMEVKNGKVIAYSLGGVNISSSADYVKRDADFAYSAVVKLTLSKSNEKTVVTKTEQSLLYAEETANQYVVVRPAEENSIADAALRRLQNRD